MDCKSCDFTESREMPCADGETLIDYRCTHPRYDGDCPIDDRLLPKKCSCDECTCVEKEEELTEKACAYCGEFRDVIFGIYCEGCGNHYTKRAKAEWYEEDAVNADKQRTWDTYFMAMCDVVATNTKCHSRKIGAVIVKDKAILSSGYNGPPRGVPECYVKLNLEQGLDRLEEPCCPRQKLGARTGTMLELCYAQHAERNAITQAARSGTSINGATLYLNDTIPCKDCIGAIINAGIKEVVCTKLEYYDANDQGEWLLNNSDLIVREALVEDVNSNSNIVSSSDDKAGGEDAG